MGVMSLKNAEFICGKRAATRLFNPMLLRVVPAEEGQCLFRSITGSTRQEAPLQVPLSTYGITWCDWRMFICLFPRCVVGSNLNHNTTYQHLCDHLTACGQIFGFQSSRLVRLFSTHTPQWAKRPVATVTPFLQIKFEMATTSEEGFGTIKCPPQNRSKWRRCQTKRIKSTQWSGRSLRLGPRTNLIMTLKIFGCLVCCCDNMTDCRPHVLQSIVVRCRYIS